MTRYFHIPQKWAFIETDEAEKEYSKPYVETNFFFYKTKITLFRAKWFIKSLFCGMKKYDVNIKNEIQSKFLHTNRKP